MKTRIIAAAVLIPVLLLLVLAAPQIIASVVFSLMLAIGTYELLYMTRLLRHKRMVIYSALSAFGVGMWSHFGAVHAWFNLGLLMFTILLFSEMMADHIKVRFSMVGMCYVAGVIVPYLLSALIRILDLHNGREMILMPFVVAFASDAGAYFAGVKLGKHKLAPVVSPNKTIEGVAGGLIAATVGMILYGLVLQLFLNYRVNYAIAILYGLLGSGIGCFGDLCFSVIKRQTGIKDYGNLIPGHGGVLDRFDSMMAVAPLMETLLILIPFAEEIW